MAYQPKSYRKFVAGSVTAAVVASAVAPVASAATPSFSDVPANHQFAEAINALAEQGTFVGKDGKFDLYGDLTRRQAAIVFSRLIDGEGKAEQVFSDVSTSDEELTKAAYEVKEAGVMTGANGKLMPYSKLTRQQMAKIIVEHFDLDYVEGSNVKINDLNQADPSLREYIQILAENGVTQVADGNFRPTESVTRGQFAAFLFRAQQGVKPPILVKGALSIEGDSQGDKLTNGSAKTYTVTLINPVSKKPVEGAVLNVTFKENLNTDFKPQRNATVTNNDNETVTPYQSTDGQEAEVEIKTDKNGKATFTVTGTNATVTPIVFLDGSNQEWDTNGGWYIPDPADGRFDKDIELSATAKAVTFEGTAYKIAVEGKRTNYAAIAETIEGRFLENGREYKITVTKPDGTPFAGGKVNVGIDELLDGELGNEPKGAYFTNLQDYVAGKGQQQGWVTLDSKGQATVRLTSTKVNDSAEPVVWIDQNSGNGAQNYVLENGEPVSDRSKVDPTNFQPSRVDNGTNGAKLEVVDLTDAAREAEYENIENVEDVKGINFTLLNQSGQPFLPDAESWDGEYVDGEEWHWIHKDARVTFTVVNTGTHPVKVHTAEWLGKPTLKDASGADDTNLTDGWVEIEVGGRVTIAGDIEDTNWEEFADINSAAIAVYSVDGASSVSVTASAVVDGMVGHESQSVAVSAGPVTAELANSSTAPEPVFELSEVKDTNNDGRYDQVILKFTEEVYNFEAGDFRLYPDATGTHYIEPVKVEYGKKTNDITKIDETKLVLTLNEIDLNLGTHTLYYDANFSGTKALSDEFGNKVKAFSTN